MELLKRSFFLRAKRRHQCGAVRERDGDEHEIYLDHLCRKTVEMLLSDQQIRGASLSSSLSRMLKKPAISGSKSSSGSAKPFSQLETVPRIRLKISSQLARGIPFRSLRILNLVPKLMGSPPFFPVDDWSIRRKP